MNADARYRFALTSGVTFTARYTSMASGLIPAVILDSVASIDGPGDPTRADLDRTYGYGAGRLMVPLFAVALTESELRALDGNR